MMFFTSAIRRELGNLTGQPVGVGPLEAAIGTTRLLADQHVDGLVFVGTAGAYSANIPIGTVIVARTMLWAHALAEMGGGYVPCPPAPIEADEALRKKLDLPCHDILTVGAITTDAEVANRLSRHATVEHMEVYSVARAAQLAGVPFTAVLGIANHVGPNAHEEWIAHHLHAEAAARDAARVLLDP